MTGTRSAAAGWPSASREYQPPARRGAATVSNTIEHGEAPADEGP
jgi:hypothetical protein